MDSSSYERPPAFAPHRSSSDLFATTPVPSAPAEGEVLISSIASSRLDSDSISVPIVAATLIVAWG